MEKTLVNSRTSSVDATASIAIWYAVLIDVWILLASCPLGIKVQETSVPDNYLVFTACETDKIAGVVLVVVGLLYPYVKHLALERLPSDIVFKPADSSFFFPIATCIMVGVVLTVILNLFR